MKRNRFTVTSSLALAAVVVASSATSATASGQTTGRQSSTTTVTAPATSPLGGDALARALSPRSKTDLEEALDLASLPTQTEAEVRTAVALLPDDYFAARGTRTAIGDHGSSAVKKALLAAIDPTQYECSDSALDAWVRTLLPDLSDPASLGEILMLSFFIDLGGLDVQTYEALLSSHVRANDYSSPTRDYATALGKSLRQAKGFWDISSDDIQLGAMDPDLWQRIDTDDTTDADETALHRAGMAWAVSQGQAATEANASVGEIMVELLDGWLEQPGLLPSLQDGQSALLTLNAFAFSGVGEPDPAIAGLPDKIVFGRGILEAVEVFGLADHGPQIILGHEFGHHIQYERAVMVPNPDDPATATRRTELMADGLGAYFSRHKRGLALNARRIVDVTVLAFNIGDCAFADAGHHGTPNQRRRAAQWGVDLADAAQRNGQVLPSQTVIDLFDRSLPALVAPDATA